MKRFNNIFPKIIDMDNLRLAHMNAKKRKTHYREVQEVDSNVDFYLKQIQEMLINGTYEVSPYQREMIVDKGKERELMKLPYFPDRIIQWAIMLQIEPIFMKTFCNHTCASIRGRGGKKARNLVKEYLKDKDGTKYCLKMDVSKFYPNINQKILKKLLREKFKDQLLLELLDKIVDSYPSEKGIPIGSYLSQFLANFYLSGLDHYIKEQLKVKYVVRYMDDIVIFSNDKFELHCLRFAIWDYLDDLLDLQLKPNYQVFPTDVRGVDFLGYRFFHDFTLLRKRNAKNFKRVALHLKKKADNNIKLTHSEWCSINSYLGWLRSCDGYRLWEKYFYPLRHIIVQYYIDMIAPKYDSQHFDEFVKKCDAYRFKIYNYDIR